MNVYAFDVDETLDCSRGPIPTNELLRLREQGHIVGIIGNTRNFIRSTPNWQNHVSFINFIYTFKHHSLLALKQIIPADNYIFIGNTNPTNTPYSDAVEAQMAGWQFVDANDYNL